MAVQNAEERGEQRQKPGSGNRHQQTRARNTAHVSGGCCPLGLVLALDHRFATESFRLMLALRKLGINRRLHAGNDIIHRLRAGAVHNNAIDSK